MIVKRSTKRKIMENCTREQGQQRNWEEWMRWNLHQSGFVASLLLGNEAKEIFDCVEALSAPITLHKSEGVYSIRNWCWHATGFVGFATVFIDPGMATFMQFFKASSRCRSFFFFQATEPQLITCCVMSVCNKALLLCVRRDVSWRRFPLWWSHDGSHTHTQNRCKQHN